MERQQLMFHMVEGDQRAHGAGLDLDALVVSGALTDYVSLPVQHYVQALQKTWLASFAPAPVEDVRDYLGEEIAFCKHRRNLIAPACRSLCTFVT